MKRRREKHGESGEGGMERWLLSYADFITLLMVFFILMYALSKVDVAKYNAIAKSLNVVLSGATMAPLDAAGDANIDMDSGAQLTETLTQDLVNAAQMEAVREQIQQYIDSQIVAESSQAQSPASPPKQLGDYIEIIEQERGLVVSIKDTLLFTSGSDELNPQAKSIMKKLGSALVSVPNHIRVEGHTDNLPINTPQFGSNWELSVMRATRVVHVFQEEAGISPARLSIGGYGEFRPMVPNNSDVNRARNRRVDVVILKSKYEDFEPPQVSPGP
jgi:chemotaxis protein MotB